MKQIIIFIICFLSSFIVVADCVNRNIDITLTKPNNIYLDHGDATVTDKETGLMWQKCSLGLSGSDCLTGAIQNFTWQAALAAANENTSSNYTDWRLPNTKELYSLVEVACFNLAINDALFPNTTTNHYWTSSSYQGNNIGHSWYVDFDLGVVGFFNNDNSYSIRLVRNAK